MADGVERISHGRNVKSTCANNLLVERASGILPAIAINDEDVATLDPMRRYVVGLVAFDFYCGSCLLARWT